MGSKASSGAGGSGVSSRGGGELRGLRAKKGGSDGPTVARGVSSSGWCRQPPRAERGAGWQRMGRRGVAPSLLSSEVARASKVAEEAEEEAEEEAAEEAVGVERGCLNGLSPTLTAPCRRVRVALARHTPVAFVAIGAGETCKGRGLALLDAAACEALATELPKHKFIGRTREPAEYPGCVRWGGGFIGNAHTTTRRAVAAAQQPAAVQAACSRMACSQHACARPARESEVLACARGLVYQFDVTGGLGNMGCLCARHNHTCIVV